MIKRPQKAPSESILDSELLPHHFPLLGSPKLDGYRCVTEDGAFTSSMKKVTNNYIQDILSNPRYNGLDGELIVGKPNLPETFNNTTGPVRKYTGEPDFKFFVFDRHDMSREEYWQRNELNVQSMSNVPFIHVVKQKLLTSVAEVKAYELECVRLGFEGAMIRTKRGLYKQGRCTYNEFNIFKRKPVVDDECTIIGFEEQMLNKNEQKRNEMGNLVRSSHKGNKVGKGTLGSFIVSSNLWPKPFAIGTGKGLTDDLRQHIWDNRDTFLGDIIVYKFQLYGSIQAPRQPIYKGFRDKNDITNY